MRFGTSRDGKTMLPHIPVLVKEVIEGLEVKEGKKYIDATVGGGGHSDAIRRLGGEVLGIDTDPDTTAIHGNFRDIENIAREHGWTRVSGILFDLGVSSHQLDTPKRGFSYRFPDAPLDMRLGGSGITAKELIEKSSEEELYEILATFGEVIGARRLSHAIKSARPLTTGELLTIVGKRDAPQVFQAIRIAVNDELGALKEGLEGAGRLLEKGGRLVVISFHSLEDRIVKQFMKRGGLRIVTKKPIVATHDEVMKNSRSRSAKLRIAEKL